MGYLCPSLKMEFDRKEAARTSAQGRSATHIRINAEVARTFAWWVQSHNVTIIGADHPWWETDRTGIQCKTSYWGDEPSKRCRLHLLSLIRFKNFKSRLTPLPAAQSHSPHPHPPPPKKIKIKNKSMFPRLCTHEMLAW